MRRLIWATLLATLTVGAASAAASSPIASICVGKKPGCYPTIQAAVDAAHDGDAITIAPGTYAGGISIDKSVRLVGAGAAATIIRGGGPVITVGSAGSYPTVSIRGVAVTGGMNDSSPGPSFAAGGGVQIAAGARVAIDDSSISGNAAAPETPFPGPTQACGVVPYDQCAFADGGGIDNSGTLVVSDTVVSDNVAGSIPGLAMVASNASGGGIESHSPGSLTLRNSTVTDNQAVVGLPNGRFTDGGGITIGGGLKIVDSVVRGNSSDVTASLSSTFPFDVEQEANAGGIDLREGSTATITSSTIDDNTVTASNTGGDANAQAGGIDADGLLLLDRSTVSRNEVRATVPAYSGNAALAIEGGLQVMGDVTMRDSRVAHNKVTAVSPGGAALATGGGFDNLGQATLERVLVDGNAVLAFGAGGVAHGGGVSNFTLDPGNPPRLAIRDSVITNNVITASPGITPQGGGLWTDQPVTPIHTVIAGNKPDQCFGC